MRVHLTMKSGNTKVGPIPVSTTEKASCPEACPLKSNGCYAGSGPLGMFWNKVSDGRMGKGWDEFCEQVAGLPEGQLWRHNQAGDLPGDGHYIHHSKLMSLVEANTGKRGFTYTHYDVMANISNAAVIHIANKEGFTINLSADNLHEADQLANLEIAPVVTIVPEDHPEKSFTPAGRKVVVCPEQTGKSESCATCQLCQHKDRGVIVAFRAHGTSKKKAQAVFLRA